MGDEKESATFDQSSTDRCVGPRLLRSRMLWLGAATLALAIALPSSAPAETQELESYRLEAVYQVPDTAPQSLARPISIKIDVAQREIIALEAEPPSVVVLTPDGGFLRRFGVEILRSPTDLAPVYPDVSRYNWDSEVSRIMVTEAALGRLHIFDAEGRLLRTVQEDWAPSAIVGITVERPERALVVDEKHARVVAVDWDGSILATGVPGAAANLAQPTLIAGTRFQHVVYDEATRRLVWFDETGSVIKGLALDDWPELSSLGSITAMACERASVLLVADQGVLAVGWPHGFDETPPTVQPIAAGALQEPVVALDLFRLVDAGELPFYRRLGLYGVERDPPGLTRYVGTDSGRWFVADLAADALHVGCPFVWERPAHAWRLAMIAPNTPAVLMTNGVVHQLVDGIFRPSGFELGYIDDWVVDPNGLITALSHGYPTTFRPGPSGLTTSASSWEPQIDCLVSGIGFRPSISALPSRAIETSSYLATERSPARGRWFNRLGLSFDLVDHFVEPDGRLTYRYGREVATDSRQTIDAPILSDVSVRGDGNLAAVVDRLGGRVVVFEADEQTAWQLAARLPVPGRPDRIAWTPDGSLAILTADGWIWRMNEAGQVTAGWDAAGLAPAPRPTLVDIAVGAGGEVYALDKYRRRLLVFAPTGQPAAEPPPELPPPCRVQTMTAASPTKVAVGQPVTVTLGLGGTCGRVSAENDILVLMQPPENDLLWTEAAFRNAVTAFVEELDPDKDRVGLMVFDAGSDVVVPLGTDFAAVSAGAAQVVSANAEYDMAARPLLRAAEQFERDGRSGANRVILLFTTGAFTRRWAVDRLVIDGETLREAGIRVIVACSNWEFSHIPALLAYLPDDYYLVPDANTMRAVYSQLGREFGARVLLRDMTLEMTLPGDMDYVAVSARPMAEWDAGTRTLKWMAHDLGFGGWQASFQVRPRQVGYRRVIHRAEADAIDGFGNRFPVRFPIPWIEVVEPPTPTATSTPSVPLTPAPTDARSKTLYLPAVLREACNPTLTHADVVLVIDTSSSMSGAKLADAKEAATAFVGLMDLTADADQVAVVRFDAGAELVSRLTSDQAAVERAIRSLDTRQGTRIDLGLLAALEELRGERRAEGNAAAVVLLTDGIQTGPPRAELAAAERVRDEGIRLYTIGLGPDVDEAALTEMAGGASRYYFAPGSRHLKQIYADVAYDIDCPPEGFWARR